MESTQGSIRDSTVLNDAIMQKLEGLDLTMENGMNIREWFESFKDSLVNQIDKQRE